MSEYERRPLNGSATPSTNRQLFLILQLLQFLCSTQYVAIVFMAILAVSSLIMLSSLISLQNPRPWRASKPGLMSIAWDAFRFTFPVIGADRGQVPSQGHHILDTAQSAHLFPSQYAISVFTAILAILSSIIPVSSYLPVLPNPP